MIDIGSVSSQAASVLVIPLELTVAVLVVYEILDIRRLRREITTGIETLQQESLHNAQIDWIQNAKSAIHQVSPRVAVISKDERSSGQSILRTIKKATGRGVEVRVLGPKVASKVGDLWEKRENGSIVKVCPTLNTFHLRYWVVDGRRSGITFTEPEQRTLKANPLDNEEISHLLGNHFDELWRSPNSTSLEEYVVEEVSRRLELERTLAVSSEDFVEELKELGIIEEDIRRSVVDFLLEKGVIANLNGKVYNQRIINDISLARATTSQAAKTFLTQGKIQFDENDIEELKKAQVVT